MLDSPIGAAHDPSLAAPTSPAIEVAPPSLTSVTSSVPGRSSSSESSGAALPGAVRAKMERAFSADFSAVRVHEGEQAPGRGALAYAQGADLHFAPGRFDPSSQAGQELIGHELAHVVQHAEGRAPGAQAKGAGGDPALEAEADSMGAAAARGEQVRPDSPVVRASRDETAVLQYKIDKDPPASADWARIKLYLDGPVNRRHQTFRMALEEFLDSGAALGRDDSAVSAAWNELQGHLDQANWAFNALLRLDLIRNAVNAVPDPVLDGYGGYDGTPNQIEAFSAKQQKERAAELSVLPIIARSEQRKHQAKDLRAFATSPLFPKDVLGSPELDAENAVVSGARGAYTATKDAMLGHALIGNGVQRVGQMGSAMVDGVGSLLGPQPPPKVDRDFVDSLRETPPGTFMGASGRMAVNSGFSVATLGVTSVLQAIASAAHRSDAADQAQSLSGDRSMPTLGRHLAAGQAATDRDKARGAMAMVPVTAVLQTFGADQVAEAFGGVIGEGITGMIEKGAESAAEVGSALGTEWTGKKVSSKVTAPAKQEDVKKAARAPAPSGYGALEDEQHQTVADMYLLHLVSLDRDFAEALVGELAKDPIGGLAMAKLAHRFPSNPEFVAAIGDPERARVRLRQLLGGGGRSFGIAQSEEGRRQLAFEQIRSNEGPGKQDVVKTLRELSEPHPLQLAAPRVLRDFPETWEQK